MCCVCENTFSEFCNQYYCQSCGRVFCGKCVGGHISPADAMDGMKGEAENGCIKLCNFCSGGIMNPGGSRKHGEKIYPSVSPEGSPEPPSPCLSGEKFHGKMSNELIPIDRLSHFTESQNNDSPNALTCSSFATSTSRSDGEEAGDFEKHFFCSSIESCYDFSDLDTSSISGRNEFYSYKSVSSSPLDSPSRINFTSHRVRHCEQKEQQESRRCQNRGQFNGETRSILRRPETDVEDLESDDLSIFKEQFEHLEKPLDFENNRLIWFPPPPVDEDAEAESSFVYDDEDDDIGESSAVFLSSGSLSNVFPAKDNYTEANKGPLIAVLQGHFRALVVQLLLAEGINMGEEDIVEKWLDIVATIAWQAANFVKTDTGRGGSMDPGDYVKVKCVASGNPIESTLVKGVVCTKNIKHKRMTSQYKKPRLILLGGALEYQKVPNQLASFDTLLQQEIDHLKIVVSKIEARRPNVILVEKSVSSYAQEYLLAKEISLVLNVKRSLLERIARCTGAVISPSIDNISTTRLGNCNLFRVERIFEELETSNQFNKRPKTLMFFEGCPRRLGCTVLLKGACHEELKKVKHVVQYAVFAAYHLSLETSFLADEGASLPKTALKPSIYNSNSIVSNSSSPTAAQAVADFLAQNEVPDEHGGWESLSEHINPGHSSSLPVPMDYNVGNALPGAQSDYLTSKPELPETMGEDRWGQVKINEVIEPERSDENEVSDEYFSATDSNQSILVVFSSHNLNGAVCERSCLLRIKFYGSFDKPLGRYLQDDLFDQTSYCRYCNEPAKAHVQCYTHQQGILTIHVKHLPSLSLPGEQDGKIWMWHRCLRCTPIDGAPPATRRIIMSDAAWGLSFGKFLELSFSNHATANRVAGCGHSLQRDCLRYYGFGGMVAIFCYSPINILSVHLPPPVLEFNGCAQQEWVKKEAAQLMSKMEALYMEISEVLNRIEEKHEPSDVNELHDHITELKELLKIEKNDYSVLLQSAGIETPESGQMTVDFLELNRLRHSLLLGFHVWDRQIYMLDSLVKTRSSISKVTEEDANHAELQGCRSDSYLKNGKHDCDRKESFSVFLKLQESANNNSQLQEQTVSGDSTDQPNKQEEMQSGVNLVFNKELVESIQFPVTSLSQKIESVWTGTDQLVVQSNETQTGSGTQINHSNPPFRRLMTPIRVYSFDSAVRIQERIRKGLVPSSMQALRSFHASGDYKNMIRDPVSSRLRTSSSTLSQESQKLSSSLNSTPSCISSLAHIAEGVSLLLPQTGLNNLVIAVYADEPASIISYALSSKEYEDWVVDEPNEHVRAMDVYNGSKEGSAASTFVAWQSFGSLDLHCIQSGAYGSEDFTSSVGTLSRDPKKTPHLRISFVDDPSIAGGNMKFSVTCYFAKQFDALRRKCCPSKVDLVRSLSRCRRWSAEGGKSKVYFARSLDERFIIKQVTKTELDSFEEFAPEYFKYLTDSLSSKSPTCLAKIIGIYQVTVKHLKGGKETKMDLMVMENLFFKRSISTVYDLKGSTRARYNADTTGANKVLLDMNLLEILRTNPIFLGSKAKRTLERAVWNDTSFLASVDVMDYSLLVGVDEEREELVLGIIDYLRQYTWDKHLETWVKASGILGGSKNASPTIVSPDQYKRRFRKAMTNYFLTVPDQLSP